VYAKTLMKKAFYWLALFLACTSAVWGQTGDTATPFRDTTATIKQEATAISAYDTIAATVHDSLTAATHHSAAVGEVDTIAIDLHDSAHVVDPGIGTATTINSSQSAALHVVQPDSANVPVRPAMDPKYGTLLNDDPAYNPKYPVWLPAARVVLANGVLWSVDRYVFNYDWSRIGPSTWRYNIRKGWEWDNDRFGVNFIGHPYSGNNYFNIARSHGYNFWQSFPFAVGGSLMWEYFGENTRPSINDIINTPVSGAYLGEVLYRVSSSILDDRTRGGERFFRELGAMILDPSRGFSRLTQGKMFRVTPYEVYQKEPMNISLNTGVQKVNSLPTSNNKFASGGTNAILDLQIDYGDPFEIRSRKPYDFFRARMELAYGYNKYIISTVNGYGLLTGKTIKENRLLGGLFQHYDYWHNNIFEVGALGFGYGLISKIPTGVHSNIYSNILFGVVPLAGNNTRYGPDTSDYRFYNFGGGLEAKVEETFNLSNWLDLGFSSFYYWIHTYDGVPGNSHVMIMQPTVALKLVRNTRIGFEQQIYHNDRYSNRFSSIHLTRTQQKLYLQFFFGNGKRKDEYH
jgi:hypothetical protein